MNRKLAWFSFLSIFFLIWGMSAFVSAAPQNDHWAQSKLVVVSTSAVPEATKPVVIPVTGTPRLGWRILLFYGLIGFAALTLILTLLDSANRSTSFYVRRKTLRDETDEK